MTLTNGDHSKIQTLKVGDYVATDRDGPFGIVIGFLDDRDEKHNSQFVGVRYGVEYGKPITSYIPMAYLIKVDKPLQPEDVIFRQAEESGSHYKVEE